MQVFTSKEAQNHFGDLMTQAIKEPVAISKYGKEAFVVMSQEEYMKFSNLEDMYWAAMADEAIAEGTMGVEKTKELMNSILGRES